jgi:hypothetical protein
MTGQTYSMWRIILAQNHLGLLFFNLAASQFALLVLLPSLFKGRPLEKYSWAGDTRVRQLLSRQDADTITALTRLVTVYAPRLALIIAFLQPLIAGLLAGKSWHGDFNGLS